MKSYLSILSFLFFIFYFLFFISPIFAQEITIATSPAPTPVQQFSPYGQSLSDFINNLVFGLKRNKIEQLNKINKGMLPPGVEFTTFESQKGLKLQSVAGGAAEPIYKAAQDYTVGSTLRHPSQGEKSLSTNLVDFFAGLLKNIADVVGVAKIGDKMAADLVKSYLPPTLKIEANGKESMMERGLPYLRCAAAPPNLCQDNKLNFVEEEDKNSN